MDVLSISASQRDAVLAWLGVPRPTRTRPWLDALLAAYAQRVPWESASRVVRRSRAGSAEACVVSPSAFWEAALSRGHGGTCFESNAALAALLASVRIPSVLTINDRPPLAACHTALLVDADGERLVVDAGFPLYAAVPLPTAGERRVVRTPWGTFSATALGPGRYGIDQHPHPRPRAFDLVDRAVPVPAYVAATCADYGADGLFLDRVVIKKIVGGDLWRFASGERPWLLERFRDGVRDTRVLPDGVDDAAAALAEHFSIDRTTVRDALTHVRPPAGP